MRENRVRFFSEGLHIEALVRRPDTVPESDRGYPVIVHGPGWVGLADSPISALYHEKFIEAGFAVVSPDYRGYGNSEGERGWILPNDQLQDLYNTITYVETVDDLDCDRVGVYGHGGTGGGNAIILAATDPRVRCVAAQSPIADGPTWIRSMRAQHEWLSFKERVRDNARRRVLEGVGELVDPREELMVATPQRRAEHTRKGTDAQIGGDFHLAIAEHLMRYRPADYIGKIAPRPLLLISLTDDVVTPEDQGAELLHELAGEPKTLVRQNEAITHYRSYEKNLDVIAPLLIDFFRAGTQISRLTVDRRIGGVHTIDRVGELGEKSCG